MLAARDLMFGHCESQSDHGIAGICLNVVGLWRCCWCCWQRCRIDDDWCDSRIGRRCLSPTRRRYGLHVERLKEHISTLDRVELLERSDLVDGEPAPVAANGVGAVSSSEVSTQQPLDAVLDVVAAADRQEQFVANLLLDAHQPRAQRLAQKCLIFLLERAVGAATSCPQFGYGDIKPAGNLLELETSGLEELRIVRRDGGRGPFHALLEDCDPRGIIDTRVQTFPIAAKATAGIVAEPAGML